jgi:hypothetical protein
MNISYTGSSGRQGGRFVKGVSGNPAGRPKGARNKVTLAVEALLDGQPTGLTRIAIARALKGDMTALKLCLDRIAPPKRDAPIEIDLPPITCAADVIQASTVVLAAVGAGEVTPGEAGQLMALISAHRAVLESADYGVRIAALEAGR